MNKTSDGDNAPLIIEKLWELWRQWRRESQGLKTSITFEQYRLLRYLDRHGPVSVSQLKDFWGVSLPAMTITTQRLEKSGYITRIRDKENQRQVNLSITRDGQAAYISWNEERINHFVPLVKRLSPEQQQEFLTLLLELSPSE